MLTLVLKKKKKRKVILNLANESAVVATVKKIVSGFYGYAYSSDLAANKGDATITIKC